MRTLVRSATALIAGLAMLAAAAQPAAATPASAVLMSRNLYLGADIRPLQQAMTQNPSAVPSEAAKVVNQVNVNSFPTRAGAIAQEVAATHPDVIGLQEVAEWYVGPYGDPAPATTPYVDYLGLLQQALAARGLHYAVAAAPKTLYDMEVPAALGTSSASWKDVRLVLQDVMLARTDNPAVSASKPQSGVYTQQVTAGGIRASRNWQSIDLRVGNRAMRVFNTHLEAFDANEAVRTAQAQELLSGPLKSSALPAALVCDCNSNPGSTANGGAYRVLTSGSGLTDAWKSLHPTAAGYSCCQPADLRLSATLNRRYDLVLAAAGIVPQTIDLLGEVSADRVGGLWPSDHAGIVAKVRVK